MRISVFGLGHVGGILAGCMARLGHTMIGLDTDTVKTGLLGRGLPPVREPGLAELIAEGWTAGRIRVCDDPVVAILESELSLVCVGTPARPDGGVDDRRLLEVMERIAAACLVKRDRHLVLVRSTALPATHDAILARLRALGLTPDFDVGYVVHPEFLREGNGIEDFFDPAIVLYGGAVDGDRELLRGLYPGMTAPERHVDRATAAVAKYAGNLFHAVKVAFANETSRWAGSMGADGPAVLSLLTADARLNLGAAYLRPGLPFGGACLPKDLAATLEAAGRHGMPLPLLEGAHRSNLLHGEDLAARMASLPDGRLLLLGLAFKPGTDDLRGSPLVLLARRLLDAGRTLRIHDPGITPGGSTGADREHLRAILPELHELLVQDLSEALAQADTVIAGHPLAPSLRAGLESSGVSIVDLAAGICRPESPAVV